uniref:Uncharacterized protein n=1 Tax=Arundo donax TaxID=35708 RepID=A0A0A9FA56_ARUDO
MRKRNLVVAGQGGAATRNWQSPLSQSLSCGGSGMRH